MYDRALRYLNSLEAPAMFTPGDNDCTDCDRPNNGGFSSLERLDHERALFFSTPYSLGQRQLPQRFKARHVPRRDRTGGLRRKPTMELSRLTYATLNIRGSCNNLCDTAPDPLEFAARNQADIAWMRDTFAEAKADGQQPSC